MQHGIMEVGSNSYNTVVINGVKYVETSALQETVRAGYDTGVCSKVVNQVEYLLSTGMELKSIKPRHIRAVKRSTAGVYLSTIKRISSKKETSMNPRFMFKYANSNGCTRLLTVLLG